MHTCNLRRSHSDTSRLPEQRHERWRPHRGPRPSPTTASRGGQRRCSRTEIDHIAALAWLMGEGMTLAEAQRIIELENEIADLRRQLSRRPMPATAS